MESLKAAWLASPLTITVSMSWLIQTKHVLVNLQGDFHWSFFSLKVFKIFPLILRLIFLHRL